MRRVNKYRCRLPHCWPFPLEALHATAYRINGARIGVSSSNELRFQKLIQGNRFFEVQHDSLIEQHDVDQSVLRALIDYFFCYVDHHSLTNDDIYEKHLAFLHEYSAHVKLFAESNAYPHESGIVITKSRIDYDVPLLCSTFLSYPRYCIFETFVRRCNTGLTDGVLVIGVSTGLELFLLQEKASNILAFDTQIGNFARQQFPNVAFSESPFSFNPHQQFKNIVMIELLEHLAEPIVLLVDAMKSLRVGGSIHFTTVNRG